MLTHGDGNIIATKGALIILGSILILFVLLLLTTPTASALPRAASFGVTDDVVSVCSDMQVAIPVNITNLEDGPVPAIIFNAVYDTRVMRVVEVHNGDLTVNWEEPVYKNFEWGTRVVLAFDPERGNEVINDGASGSVALLVFNVSGGGEPGSWSILSFSDIQLAEGPPDYLVGTAPSKSAIVTIERCSLKGCVRDAVGRGVGGAEVNLTLTPGGTPIASTYSDSRGNYWFTDLGLTSPGDYYLSVTKRRFWTNHTTVHINSSSGSGMCTRADIKLLLVGDLNDNGVAADIADVGLMWNAWANLIPKDFRYDLNHDGLEADIVDVTLMWNAWRGEIVLE